MRDVCVSDVSLKAVCKCACKCACGLVTEGERKERKSLCSKNGLRYSESWVDAVFVFYTSEAGR